MQLFENRKGFSQFFFAFSKSILTFEHFQKKITLVADVFRIWRSAKSVVRYISEKSIFKGPFNRQHGKPAQTLLQSEPQHRFHI